MAALAARLSAMADGLLLPAPLGPRGSLVARPPYLADGGPRTSGARCLANRSHHRQPEHRTADRKGDARPTMQAGRSRTGNAISRPTQTHGCSPSRSREPIFRIAMAQRACSNGPMRGTACGAPRALFLFVEHVFADGGCAGKLTPWAKDKVNVTIEVVRRLPFMTGFVVLRRRWVVERTFAWIMKCRHLVRDCEQLARVFGVENFSRASRSTMMCIRAEFQKSTPGFVIPEVLT